MVKYTFTFLEGIYEQIISHIADGKGKEMAGYVFAGVSETTSELRFMGREFWPVRPEHIISNGTHGISIRSDSYCLALQHADKTGQSFWFLHSHPKDFGKFSEQDDLEEPKLFRTAYTRIEGNFRHGSIVFPDGGPPFGRVWLSDTTKKSLERIRVIGKRFQIFDRIRRTRPIPEFFDRQVRAFGPDLQRLLGSLKIAVVGSGGTGSSVSEQLIRLGIGRLYVFDPQPLEKSNVNRVYGSSSRDEGVHKVEILRRLAEHVGVGTEIHCFPHSIYQKETAQQLRDADVIFGCTDEDAARGILCQIAIRYAIPVIDMGILIDSENQIIRSVTGRVTVLYPRAGCLFCRGRISPERAAHDVTRFFNPDEAESRRKEGYAPELRGGSPAVIPFTTMVAGGAVSELLHRLTGFMGADRTTTEVIYRFDKSEIGRNASPPGCDCFCANESLYGRGDEKLFLGMLWQ